MRDHAFSSVLGMLVERTYSGGRCLEYDNIRTTVLFWVLPGFRFGRGVGCVVGERGGFIESVLPNRRWGTFIACLMLQTAVFADGRRHRKSAGCSAQIGVESPGAC